LPPGRSDSPAGTLAIATPDAGPLAEGDAGTNVPGMTDEEPTVEELKQRQLAQELAERDALDHADTGADADKHQRRADKARYLREKLQERERADRQAESEDRP
jgi:hypothetical protein